MIRSRKAGGNIRPSRFVKISTVTDMEVLEADAGDQIFGISQMGVRRAEYINTDGYAAISGDDLEIFCDHEHCLLEIVATVTAGQRLKSDADGKGTPVTTDLDNYGAVAQQGGAAGDLIQVLVFSNMQYGV